MPSELRLPALSLRGLSPDSLGNYLASLGLLRVLSSKWPSTRIAWRDEALQVVGGPPTLEELLDELVRVANTQVNPDVSKRAWTQYDKAWSRDQEASKKAKSGKPLALWQAKAPESQLLLFAAHAVPHAGVSQNPILKSYGGKRNFSKGWTAAVNALATSHGHVEEQYEAVTRKANDDYEKPQLKARTKKTEAASQKQAAAASEKYQAAIAAAENGRRAVFEPRDDLRSLLLGLPISREVSGFNGGSWFSEATKVYNSGQSSAREGQISPWAMVLSIEGLVFLAGGASRRLGVRSARALGAFPFITLPIAASAEKEVDRLRAEVWTPLWNRPMSFAEVTTLFARGRAELNGRGALTPAAFATSIRKRGVDAGISEFRRFTLGHWTSPKTVEPEFKARFALDLAARSETAAALVLERITRLIETPNFPTVANPKERERLKKNWSLKIRGQAEAALLDVAAQPSSPQAGMALLDAVVSALDRIDHNRSFRESTARWEPLPLEWLTTLFAEEQPGAEARLALSLVSAFSETLPFAAFRFGVEWSREQGGNSGYDWATQPIRFAHSKTPPARWVWGPGSLARVLAAVLARRLLEEEKRDAHQPVRPRSRAPLPATADQLRRWLAGDIDESLLLAWLSRLALFDWRQVPREVLALAPKPDTALQADGELALWGLLQPLIDLRPLIVPELSPDDLLATETGVRTNGAARSLVNLIRTGNFDAALRLAASRYAMAGARLAAFDVSFGLHDPDRLAAALLFTTSVRERSALFARWLRPQRQPETGMAHVFSRKEQFTHEAYAA